MKCNQKMAQLGLKPWPFSSQESMLTAEPAGHSATKSTNEPYPFVKNIYYIMFVY